METIVQFGILIDANAVTATNLCSGGVRKFTIRTTQCEINGDRDYLVEEKTNLRVRLFGRDEDSINRAVLSWIEGFFDGRLYKHE